MKLFRNVVLPGRGEKIEQETEKALANESAVIIRTNAGHTSLLYFIIV